MRSVQIDGVEALATRPEKLLVPLLEQDRLAGETKPLEIGFGGLETWCPAEAGLLPVERAALLRPIVAVFIGELVDADDMKRTAELARGVEGERHVATGID